MYKFIIYFLSLFVFESANSQNFTFRNITFSKYEVKIYKNGTYIHHNYLKPGEEVSFKVANADRIHIEIRNYEKKCDNYNYAAQKFLAEVNAKTLPGQWCGEWIMVNVTVVLPPWSWLFEQHRIITPPLDICPIP